MNERKTPWLEVMKGRADGGLSLLEVLMAVVIVGVLGLVIGTLFLGTARSQNRSVALVNLQWEYSMALDRIGRSLRDAKWVTVGPEGAWATFHTPTVDAVTQGQIRLEGAVLVIEKESDTDRDLAFMSSLRFTPFAGRVGVNLQVAAGNERMPEAGPGSSMVEMRNRHLAAQWSFDEGSGEVSHDSSGKGNHASIYNATWVAGPRAGHALSFSPFSNSYVKAPGGTSLSTIAPGRAVYEFNVRVTLSGSLSLSLYSRGDTASDTQSLWIYVRRSDGAIVFRAADDTQYRVVESDGLTWDASRWYRVRVAHDNSDQTVAIWRYYRKTADEAVGDEPLEVDEEVAYATLPRPLQEVDSVSDAYIGQAMVSGALTSNTAFNGEMDEVIISIY